MKKKNSDASFGVIGLGRFGSALVQTLSQAGKEVIAIDKDERRVKAVRKYTDFAFVVDNLEQDTLESTGIQNCGAVTICIGEAIDVSILTTMLVIKMGIPSVIAKANSRAHGDVLKQLGAVVVYPEADMAVRIGKRLISSSLIDYISLDDNVEVRRIAVSGSMAGRSIQELNVRGVYGINIIAIEREHQTDVEFPPQYVFNEGDIVAVIGKADKIDRFEREIQN